MSWRDDTARDCDGRLICEGLFVEPARFPRPKGVWKTAIPPGAGRRWLVTKVHDENRVEVMVQPVAAERWLLDGESLLAFQNPEFDAKNLRCPAGRPRPAAEEALEHLRAHLAKAEATLRDPETPTLVKTRILLSLRERREEIRETLPRLRQLNEENLREGLRNVQKGGFLQ